MLALLLTACAADLPAGYTIPTLDLVGQTDRQTVVDREAGQYLGHVSTTLLPDRRTILAFYPKGHGAGAIVFKRSDDGGRTWSDRLPTPENWADSQETPTVYQFAREGAPPRLVVFSGLHPCRTAVSEDLGATWTPLAPVGDWGGIVLMGDVIHRADGSHVALFHDDGRYLRGPGGRGRPNPEPVVMTLYQSESTDGGLTWGEPTAIFAAGEIHLCEPGAVRSPDGQRIAVLLRENRRRRNSYVILTDDEGRTWSEPRELPAALTGDRHTARYAPDGRLVVTFRDTTRDSPTKGDWVAWVGRFEDIESGAEGQYRVRLMDNRKAADCAYPGLEILPDGTFVATTYGHWTAGAPPYVVSVRFTLEELDEMAGRP